MLPIKFWMFPLSAPPSISFAAVLAQKCGQKQRQWMFLSVCRYLLGSHRHLLFAARWPHSVKHTETDRWKSKLLAFQNTTRYAALCTVAKQWNERWRKILQVFFLMPKMSQLHQHIWPARGPRYICLRCRMTQVFGKFCVAAPFPFYSSGFDLILMELDD